MTTRNSPPRRAATVTSNQKTLIAAAAAVIGASGVLMTVPAPAQAAPCTQWGFPNGGNGFTNNMGQYLLFQAAGKTVSQAPASWGGPDGVQGSGYLNGAINGSGLNLTWKGDGGPPHFTGGATITFVGTVNNDGSAGGTVSYSGSGPGSFTSNNPMTCLDAPPAAPPPPPPGGPAPLPIHDPGPPIHTGKPKTPTATVNADTDLYDVPSDQGGHIIGRLNSGQVVKVVSACSPDAWCTLADPAGAAWGRDLTNN